MVEGAEERREKTKFYVSIGANCTVGTFACSSYRVLAKDGIGYHPEESGAKPISIC